jgi:hypothetical protein
MAEPEIPMEGYSVEFLTTGEARWIEPEASHDQLGFKYVHHRALGDSFG